MNYLCAGLSTWNLLRRDMKIVSSPNKDAFRFVCSTVSGVDFTVSCELNDSVY